MTPRVEITDADLELILEALDDAAYYRDTRSRVLRSAVKRRNPRSPSSITIDPEARGADAYRQKAKAYEALATRLRNQR